MCYTVIRSIWIIPFDLLAKDCPVIYRNGKRNARLCRRAGVCLHDLLRAGAPDGKLNYGVAEEIKRYDLDLVGVLPQDELVYEYDCEGKPSSQVPDNAPVKQALAEIMQKLGL